MHINETRARCIKAPRDAFCGGFVHTAYAVKNYSAHAQPDVLILNTLLTALSQ